MLGRCAAEEMAVPAERLEESTEYGAHSGGVYGPLGGPGCQMVLAGWLHPYSAKPSAMSTSVGAATSILRRMVPRTWALEFALAERDGRDGSMRRRSASILGPAQ